MPTVHQTFDPASITSLLTTELNALGTTAISALGTAYDNTAGLYLFGLFQVDVTFASAPTAGSDLALYLVPAPDGTNYNDSVAVQNLSVGSFNMRAVTTQQLLSLWGVLLPPTKFKLQLWNNTNQNMPATGSTVKFIPYGFKSA